MFAVYREFEGSMHLAAHVLRRFWVLKFPPVMEELVRQIYFTGASATATIVVRGAFIGTLIIAYVIEVLEADVIHGHPSRPAKAGRHLSPPPAQSCRRARSTPSADAHRRRLSTETSDAPRP